MYTNANIELSEYKKVYDGKPVGETNSGTKKLIPTVFSHLLCVSYLYTITPRPKFRLQVIVAT